MSPNDIELKLANYSTSIQQLDRAPMTGLTATTANCKMADHAA